MENENKGSDGACENANLRGEAPMEAVEKRVNEAIVGFGTVGADENAREGGGNAPESASERTGDIRCVARHGDILAALEKCESISKISERLRIPRRVVAKYIHENPDLQGEYDDAKEKKLDLMEEVILDVATIDSANTITENGAYARNDGRVMASNLNAAKFWLERLGKRRGWHEKIETEETGTGGRIPMIFLGNVDEARIAEADAVVAEANKAAGIATA